jgi:hypothetical protein
MRLAAEVPCQFIGKALGEVPGHGARQIRAFASRPHPCRRLTCDVTHGRASPGANEPPMAAVR